MQNPIKVFLSTILAIFLTSTLIAQAPSKAQNRATKMLERLTERLDLSEAQVKQVSEIISKQQQQRAESATQEERPSKQQRKEMKIAFEKEMKTILNEEQFTKFQEMPKHKRGHKGKGKHGLKGKGKHKEMRMLHKEKITPILLEQRAKLETKISAADKETLETLRVAHQNRKLERKAQKGKGQQQDKKERKEARQNDPNHIKLKELTQKYSSDIEPLLAAVKEEIKTIKQSMKEEKKGKKGERTKGQRAHKKEGDKKIAHQQKRQQRKYAHFLLLDPTKTAEQQIQAPLSGISNVTVYPNPSPGISQVEYELEEGGEVLIELRDQKGQLIQTIEQSIKTAGKHKAVVNLERYNAGVYLIVLTDAQGNVISEQVIK